VSYEYWKGHDFYTEAGDPLYQTDEMSTVALFKRIGGADDRLRVVLEAKGRWLEKKFAHSQLVRVEVALDKRRKL
jgi:hypothetical protein